MRTRRSCFRIRPMLSAAIFCMLCSQSQEQEKKDAQAFEGLDATPVIEQAIGVADIAFGADVNAPNETLAFTGPVIVHKWPMEGYSRTVLSDGRVQISAEIVDRNQSSLGERSAISYILKAPVRITVAPGYPGNKTEGPRAPQLPGSKFSHRSQGTITQVTPGVDFPAEVEMGLYLNILTPQGVLHNETPIVLKALIDHIPPIKVRATEDGQNEWHSTNMPIPFMDDDGHIHAWMTTRAHKACLVHPTEINQVRLSGTVAVTAKGKTERLSFDGMSEIHRYDSGDNVHSRLEVIQMYLHGNSGIFGGPVDLVTPNKGCRRVPMGELSQNSAFVDLPVILKTLEGELRTNGAIQVDAHDAKYPSADVSFHSTSERALINATGKQVGSISSITLEIKGKFEHPPNPWVFYLPRPPKSNR